MPARTPLVKGLIVALTLVVAIVTVGLSASASDPFSIGIRPAFLRLGIDVDIKLGTFHLHAGWSALPSTPSTKCDDDPF